MKTFGELKIKDYIYIFDVSGKTISKIKVKKFVKNELNIVMVNDNPEYKDQSISVHDNLLISTVPLDYVNGNIIIKCEENNCISYPYVIIDIPCGVDNDYNVAIMVGENQNCIVAKFKRPIEIGNTITFHKDHICETASTIIGGVTEYLDENDFEVVHRLINYKTYVKNKYKILDELTKI